MKTILQNQLFSILKCPSSLLIFLEKKEIIPRLSDEKYLRIMYKYKTGENLNLAAPLSFNEKLQWLKLYDRNASYSELVDKYRVKQIVKEKIGEEFVIPTLAVWDNADEIDFSSLPDKFVLKCTHDSGGVYICDDRNNFDSSKVRNEISKALKKNYYTEYREWPYKDVTPRVIAEPFIETDSSELIDYKFLCSKGEPFCVFTCTSRAKQDLRVDFFDLEWNHLPFTRHYPNSDTIVAKPFSFEKMLDAARVLSQDMTFVRVDFYEVQQRPLFGEITLYPGSGFEEFTPSKWDVVLGEHIKLPIEIDG